MVGTGLDRWAAGAVLVAASLLLVVLLSAGPVEAAPPASAGNTSTILVKFKPGASENAIKQLNAGNAVQQVETLPALGVRLLRVPATQDPAVMAARYAKNPLVEFAEVNALVAPGETPDDPMYGNAWHLGKVEAPAAWEGAKASGVLVAVCDTGVEGSHPDLAPVLRGDLGFNTADGSMNWSPNGAHGTYVAGAVAAATNNATGVAGVAWGAAIIPVRISNLSGGSAYISDAAECITYAADKGARVINLSYRMAGYSTIDSAAKYAEQRGAVTTVAAGNDNTDPGWPDFPSFLAIAATTSTDARASYSNYGSFVDVAAPGSSILTTKAGGTYGGVSGTSLASPVAAGVVALIFGADPSLTAAEAKAILLSTADDLGAAGEDAYFGAGRVNAAKAVAAANGGSGGTQPESPPPDTAAPSVTFSSPKDGAAVSGLVTVQVSASDTGGVERLEVYRGATLLGAASGGNLSIGWDTTLEADGQHTLTGRARDAAGNWGESAITITVSNPEPDTTPPSVGFVTPQNGAAVSGTVMVQVTASDTSGVERTEVYKGGTLLGASNGASVSLDWDTASEANGEHALTGRARDAAGNWGEVSVTVVVDNGEPEPQPVTETFNGQVGGKNKPASQSHSFTVQVEGPLDAKLSWKGKAVLAMSIQDGSGEVLASVTGKKGNAKKTEAVSLVLAPGTYQVTVTAVSGQANYALTVTHW